MQQECLKRFNKRKIHHFTHLGYVGASLELTYENLIHPSENDHIKYSLKDLPSFSIDEDNLLLNSNSGIYAITFNNKTFYIGETVQSFKQRFEQHKKLLLNDQHYNKRLQKSFNKNKKFPKVYLIEYAKCTDNVKGYFKLLNLFREFYYQQLFIKDGFGLNNEEDTLQKLYLQIEKSWALPPYCFKDLSDCSYCKLPNSLDELKFFVKEDNTFIKENNKRIYEIICSSLFNTN